MDVLMKMPDTSRVVQSLIGHLGPSLVRVLPPFGHTTDNALIVRLYHKAYIRVRWVVAWKLVQNLLRNTGNATATFATNDFRRVNDMLAICLHIVSVFWRMRFEVRLVVNENTASIVSRTHNAREIFRLRSLNELTKTLTEVALELVCLVLRRLGVGANERIAVLRRCFKMLLCGFRILDERRTEESLVIIRRKPTTLENFMNDT
jgi:hypothetical protein